jgi:hypothetical protein
LQVERGRRKLKDHAIGVERKVIVDKELGIAAEVENVAVAVDLGGA